MPWQQRPRRSRLAARENVTSYSLGNLGLHGFCTARKFPDTNSVALDVLAGTTIQSGVKSGFEAGIPCKEWQITHSKQRCDEAAQRMLV
jgi:hypothetical protein